MKDSTLPSPRRLRAIRLLVRPDCTLTRARHLFEKGDLTKKDFNRYLRIWEGCCFRSNSKTQDALYAFGGWAALERRFQRAKNLQQAWINRCS